jgi:two-component system OmpR family response regulator
VNILLIEDNAETSNYVSQGLREFGHAVDCALTGPDGLARARSGRYAALIVDRMLPGLDGLTLVKALRAEGNETAVLFLTTVSRIGDRVEGLEAGGDDYLVKPFDLTELAARLNALLRRASRGATAATRLCVGDLEIDVLTRAVRRSGSAIALQPQEFKLLEYLMRNAGNLVTRTMLLENVWNLHFDPRTNVVETHMSRLRSKVDRGFGSELIQTVRGAGYTIRAD